MKANKCPVCKGTGEVFNVKPGRRQYGAQGRRCPECDGSGARPTVPAPPAQPVGQGSGTPEGYKPHQRGDWESAIAGVLKQEIDAHGPITKEWIGSAAKRVVGLAKAWRQDELTSARTALATVTAEKEGKAQFIENLQRDVAHLQGQLSLISQEKENYRVLAIAEFKKLADQLEAARASAERARKDGERLDWLESKFGTWNQGDVISRDHSPDGWDTYWTCSSGFHRGSTVRAAIDAAIAAALPCLTSEGGA